MGRKVKRERKGGKERDEGGKESGKEYRGQMK